MTGSPGPGRGGTSEPDTSRRRRKGGPSAIAKRIIALVLTGLTLYVLLPSVAKVFDAWPQLSSLSAVWLVVAVTAEVSSFACTFGVQRIVLRTRDSFAVVTAGLAGNAVTNTLPGGDATGAAIQFRMLSTAGIKTDTAAGGLAASSLLSIGGLLALPILTLPAVLGGSGVNHALTTAALIGVAGFAVYVGLGAVLLTTQRPLLALGKAAQWLWNKLRRHRPRLVGLDQRLLVQRNDIRRELGREWRKILLLIAGRLGFDFLCLLAALRATGSQPHPWLVLLAYSTAGIIALLPVTPGGLGIVEASLSGLLVLAGVDTGKAVVATLAYRLAQYWLPIIGGVISYGLFRRRYGPDPA